MSLSPTTPLTVRRVAGVVSTDDILPARYKHRSTDPHELAAHVFESYAPGLAPTLAGGTVLVSDELFGIGSSREQAVLALRTAGVAAVVAPAFGRIFYRNCWNLAVPAITAAADALADALTDGDEVRVDIAAGRLTTASRAVEFPAVDSHMAAILEAGGLLAWVKQGAA